jgi:hypothetical protein
VAGIRRRRGRPGGRSEFVLTWLEASPVAATVRDSLMLTAVLSALHAIGFTLIMGSGLVVNLRRSGMLLTAVPLAAVVRPGHRGLALGLALSVATGVLLFAPRAGATIANGTFQLKMLLLVSAVGLQWLLAGRDRAATGGSTLADRCAGAGALVLWIALALVACAFILFE